MRVSLRLSGRAVARRKGIESFTRRGAVQGAVPAGRCRAEWLERRLLLSAVGEQQGLELADLRPRALREVPVHRPGSVNSGVTGYQIDVNFVGTWTPTQQAAFTQAAARWEQIITGDIPDANTSAGVVDDLRINAISQFIDGPGGILGAAGPEEVRSGSFLPALGSMQFDTADLPSLEAQGQFVTVILHEMAHVIGLGTIWSLKGLITDGGGSNPRFTGANATAEFNAIFSMEEATVPVENTGGPGTRDGHWRESVFGNELMTGFLNAGTNPLSRVTAAQFIDMGYPGVMLAAADAYTSPNPAPLVGSLSDSPDPVAQGASVTLTATGVSDPGGSVASVSFYRESNGVAGLQATGASPDTILSTDSVAGDGYTATASTSGLAPGSHTYYARARDAAGALSAAASTTNFVQGGGASATPGVPDLLPAFDSGSSNTDNLTRLDNSAAGAALQFSVPNTVPGATVTILADGVAIGSATAADVVTVVATNGSADLAEGARSITARQTEPGKDPSAGSFALSVTVDTVAPGVNSATFLFQSSPHRLTYGFNESVQASLAAADLTVRDLGTGQTVGFSGPAYDAGTNVATFTFAGALANANYSATLTAPGVTDAAGNPLPVDHLLRFFSLTGDVNRDHSVNGTDFAILAGNFGRTGMTYAQGDLNGDGSVNGTDFALLASNFGQSLPFIPAVVAGPALPQSAAVSPSSAAPARRLPQPVRPARRVPPASPKQRGPRPRH